jgi:dethiobiotin synthase
MLRGIFITGTDTNVGKTVVASALMQRYRSVAALRYWKPIQTGIEKDNDTTVVRWLGACADEEVFDEGYRLPRPLSPHLSARLSNKRIEVESLIRIIGEHPPTVSWIIEGAGGFLVPLNEHTLLPALIAQLNLPVLIVARSGLGTINHTLLTLEALSARMITTAGVVLVGNPHPENRETIEQFGQVPVIAEMSLIKNLSPTVLSQWAKNEFDKQGILRQVFE